MRTKIAFATASLLVLALTPLAQGAGETQPCQQPFDTQPPFTDYCYHQGVWYIPDTAHFDVLIVPPVSPWIARDIQLVEESVQMWDDGIHALGVPATANLLIDQYTLGMDAVPPQSLWDPEVVVLLTTEANPFVLLGLATLQPINFCHGIELSAYSEWADVPGFHQHPGSPFGSILAACASGGKQCYVINTNFLWTPTADQRQWMYDLISHEVGHCLGLGHVGDADTENTDNSYAYPHDDIMSYESDGRRASRTHCVSNLNVRVIEKAFSSILTPPGSTATAPNPAAYVHMKPSDYSQPTCPAPDALFTDVGYLLTADPLGL